MKTTSLLLSILFMISFTFFQCDDVIEEVNLNNAKVTLIAPADSTILSSGKIYYNWESLNNQLNNDTINTLYYHFQLATPNFTEALQILNDTVIANQTRFSDSLQTKGQYEWRVKAFYNSATSTEYTTHQFTIE